MLKTLAHGQLAVVETQLTVLSQVRHTLVHRQLALKSQGSGQDLCACFMGSCMQMRMAGIWTGFGCMFLHGRMYADADALALGSVLFFQILSTLVFEAGSPIDHGLELAN